MGLGFVAWVLAARLFAASEVGLASAVVSAITLCSQVALLGVGSAVIALYPQHRRDPALLLDTAFSVIAVSGLVAGGIFLILASSILHELRVVGASPAYALSFLTMSVFGALGVAYDQTSTVMRRGDQALVRGILSGLVTVIVIGVVAGVTVDAHSLAIFSAWVIGQVGACLLGVMQLRRSVSRYWYRPRADSVLTRRLLGIGLPNYALTMVERAPGPIMPIVVTELLSPVATAHWYAVWMMAWDVFIIHIQVGMTLFAEASHEPDMLAVTVRRAIRSALAIGACGALGMMLVARIALSFLGSAYAAAGTVPLRILVFAVLPTAFIQAYFAACRATRRLSEAVVTGLVSGLLSVGVAAFAGLTFGLTGMAVAWLAIQALTGLWAILRLRRLTAVHR